MSCANRFRGIMSERTSSIRIVLTRVSLNIIMMSFALYVVLDSLGVPGIDFGLCGLLVCGYITSNLSTAGNKPTLETLHDMAIFRGYFATIWFALSLIYYILR